MDAHRRLALWAAACAETVLARFEAERPGDARPRAAIEAARAWVRGELAVTDARKAAVDAQAAAREATGEAAAAARAAGHAAATAHLVAHASHAADDAAKAGEPWEELLVLLPVELHDRVLPRQKVERAGSGRRARLTPAPGSDPSPEAPPVREPGPARSADDERYLRDRPPHW